VVRKKEGDEVIVNGDSIRVQYGVHAIKLSPNYAGKTIKEIIDLTSGILNLPDDGVGVIANGEVLDDVDGYAVEEGDKLEFVKSAGRKG